MRAFFSRAKTTTITLWETISAAVHCAFQWVASILGLGENTWVRDVLVPAITYITFFAIGFFGSFALVGTILLGPIVVGVVLTCVGAEIDRNHHWTLFFKRGENVVEFHALCDFVNIAFNHRRRQAPAPVAAAA